MSEITERCRSCKKPKDKHVTWGWSQETEIIENIVHVASDVLYCPPLNLKGSIQAFIPMTPLELSVWIEEQYDKPTR